jgi:hypothetical protein
MCKLLSLDENAGSLVHKDSSENSDDSPVPLKMLPKQEMTLETAVHKELV